ncbi:hypothetical protein ANN_11096 [Periplaneta americana]|uniref:Uncharacterized protein n=1 Tax=Periplaneta americana TaxID=6978 RepID=A0ABQ8T5U3_PERAM|nr:hypothetical protein ANN_11096 [Periplaneta americana]
MPLQTTAPVHLTPPSACKNKIHPHEDTFPVPSPEIPGANTSTIPSEFYVVDLSLTLNSDKRCCEFVRGRMWTIQQKAEIVLWYVELKSVVQCNVNGNICIHEKTLQMTKL